MAGRWLVVIDTLGRPPISNARQHWGAKAKVVADWRAASGWHARAAKVPQLGAITLRVWGRYPNRRSLPDPEALAPALKAALDGLVDVRVVPDDTSRYVRSVTFLPPHVAPGPPALVIEVVEVPSGRPG